MQWDSRCRTFRAQHIRKECRGAALQSTKTRKRYSGYVSEASAEKGRKLVKISEDGIVKLIENWLSQRDVPGSW